MNEYKNLSESELEAVLGQVTAVLEEKKLIKRTQVIKEIEDLAASIDVLVTISDNNPDAKGKRIVPAKYYNPDNRTETWSGRGKPPAWMRVLIEAGHDKSEFLIS